MSKIILKRKKRMKLLKHYNDIDVYQATLRRINYIFDNFEKICVSFSTGKDSGVLLNIAIDVARKRARKISLMFLDEEALPLECAEFAKRIIDNNLDVFDKVYWFCLPITNGAGFIPWDATLKDRWLRQMPTGQYIITSNNCPFDFSKFKTVHDFYTFFNAWFAGSKDAAFLIGLRASESYERFKSTALVRKNNYRDITWSTKRGHAVSFYPIYDWETKDIWIYNCKFKKDYNRFYDKMHQAGVPITQMRVAQVFCRGGIKSLNVLGRVSNIDFTSRHPQADYYIKTKNDKINNAHYSLPQGHTWESFFYFTAKQTQNDKILQKVQQYNVKDMDNTMRNELFRLLTLQMLANTRHGRNMSLNSLRLKSERKKEKKEKMMSL